MCLILYSRCPACNAFTGDDDDKVYRCHQADDDRCPGRRSAARHVFGDELADYRCSNPKCMLNEEHHDEEDQLVADEVRKMRMDYDGEDWDDDTEIADDPKDYEVQASALPSVEYGGESRSRRADGRQVVMVYAPPSKAAKPEIPEPVYSGGKKRRLAEFEGDDGGDFRPKNVPKKMKIGGTPVNGGRWTEFEVNLLLQIGGENVKWRQIAAEHFPLRSPAACQTKYRKVLNGQNIRPAGTLPSSRVTITANDRKHTNGIGHNGGLLGPVAIGAVHGYQQNGHGFPNAGNGYINEWAHNIPADDDVFGPGLFGTPATAIREPSVESVEE